MHKLCLFALLAVLGCVVDESSADESRPSSVLASNPSSAAACIALIAACSTNGAVVTPEPPASVHQPASSPPPAPTSAVAEVGQWNLPGKIDAVSLEVRSDGSFAWSIDGCDFGGGDKGTWQRDKTGGLRLSPPIGQTSFKWDGEVGLETVTTLRVVRTGAHLSVTGQTNLHEALTQTWHAGAVCASCGGSLGPAAPPHPCATPKQR